MNPEASPNLAPLTREEFLGRPKITGNANASDLKPSAITSLARVAGEPFMQGRYTARFAPSGSAVFDGDKVIACYDFGDTLVVSKGYRGQGIALELVYQWRSRYLAPAVAKTRTKASQSIQEKVWERMERELNQFSEVQKMTFTKFEEGELLHGTTREAAQMIEAQGLIPLRGAFINKMYGHAEDDAPGLPGVFFSNPNDESGIWGAANAMRQAVSRLLAKDWHGVTLADIAAHGALLVVEPDKHETYKLQEDGSSTSLAGYVTYTDPPSGAECGDYYSFERQDISRMITGDELVALTRTVRRYGDDGIFLFKCDKDESVCRERLSG